MARFRFVRDRRGKIVALPGSGESERCLLAIDEERWGLVRVRLFEGAARHAGARDRFDEAMSRFAALRSEALARPVAWGRHEEYLYCAEAGAWGEPLPLYLARAGALPPSLAAAWVLELGRLLVGAPGLHPILPRFASRDLEIGVDRRGRIHLVLHSGGASLKADQAESCDRDRPLAGFLAKAFCCLASGIADCESGEIALPHELETSLPLSARDTLRRALAGAGDGPDSSLLVALSDLAGPADGTPPALPPPRLPLREWLRAELASSSDGAPDHAIPDEWAPPDESFASPGVVRGLPSWIQVLPGPDAIPRSGWLHQHHEATRRPGLPRRHELRITHIEDLGSLTLVGEEQPEGVDLRTVLDLTGPLPPEIASALGRRLESAIDSLEGGASSCEIWWLPPENIYLLSGSDLSGTARALQTQGPATWEEWPVKLRLHQTARSLCDGIDLPPALRPLCEAPGRSPTALRRLAVGLPLLFHLLAGGRFRWDFPLAEQSALPDGTAAWLETRRLAAQAFVAPGAPADRPPPDESFFAAFAKFVATGGESAPEPPAPQAAPPIAEPPAPKTTGPITEPPLPVPSPVPSLDIRPSPLFARLVWPALAGALLSLATGYALVSWNGERGPAVTEGKMVLPPPHYQPPPFPNETEILNELRGFVIEAGRPEWLDALRGSGIETLRSALESRAAEGDPAAPRLLSFLAFLTRPADGTLETEGEAALLLLESARRGDARAQHLLAVRTLHEGHASADPAEALHLLERAASLGHSDAQEMLAIRLLDEGEPARGREFLESAARRGHLGAIYHLGILEAAGADAAPDPEAAAARFAEAAGRGDARAMVALGLCLETGFGLPPSLAEATRWMKSAALLGEESAASWCRVRGVDPRSSGRSD